MGCGLALVPLAGQAQDCGATTQIEANICARDRWQAADDALNAIWAEAKPAADAQGAGAELLAEQRAWTGRRDALCERELQGGGSAAAMFYWSCMEEMTQARTRELRDLIS